MLKGRKREITKTTDWTIFSDLQLDMPTPNIHIQTATGKTLILDLSGDTIEIKGDADLSEAAKIFFDEVVGLQLKANNV